MKQRILFITVGLCVLALPFSSQAAPKKEAAAATDAAEKAAAKPKEMAKDGGEKVPGAKAIPMHVRADAIDTKAKTFTLTRKDGVQVKHVITDKTEIMNGDAPAKLADVKIGEYVSGLRLKKSDTEYEVVKITKFGPAPEKKAKEPKAEGEKKMEKKKAE